MLRIIANFFSRSVLSYSVRQSKHTNYSQTYARTHQSIRHLSSEQDDTRKDPNQVTVTSSKPDGKKITVRASKDKSLYDAVIDNNVDIDGSAACESALNYESLPPEGFVEDSAVADPDINEAMQEFDDGIYEREFDDVKLEDYEELYKDDETGTIKERIQIILSEYDYLKYNGEGRAPTSLDKLEMCRLLNEGHSPNLRFKILDFLFKREMLRRSVALKKERLKAERALVRQAKQLEMTEKFGGVRTGLLSKDGDLIYGLWHNSLFMRVPENKLKYGDTSSKLIQAALFGRKLIFDFDYEQFMEPWLYRNVIDQIQEAYGLNRYRYDEPFDVWFCNYKKDSPISDYLEGKAFKSLFGNSMITVKNDCFTKHFDKSRLVYLSPDSREKVTDICNNDDIYIIGAFNDRSGPKPLSYRKAVSLGVRTQSLPLDSYVAWQGGSKSLCVNHVTGILLEVMANGGDWRGAFLKYIPSRKLKPLDEVIELEQQRQNRLKRKKKRIQFSIRDDLDL